MKNRTGQMHSQRRHLAPPSAGFSMIEILITMLITSLALVGAAFLSVQSMKLNHGARYRGQAVMLSNDIAERIEANKTAATTGAYTVATDAAITSSKNCMSSACSAGELATYDLSDWIAHMGQTLPGASWTISQVVVGNPATYQITVSWLDRGVNPKDSSAPRTERFSYITSKSVYQ